MATILHAFLFDETRIDEQQLFQQVRDYFGKNPDASFSEITNPFTTGLTLKMIVDPKFAVTFKYEANHSVIDDYREIAGEDKKPCGRIRILTSPDANNDFDHIVVGVLEFLSLFPSSRIYSVSTKKFIE